MGICQLGLLDAYVYPHVRRFECVALIFFEKLKTPIASVMFAIGVFFCINILDMKKIYRSEVIILIKIENAHQKQYYWT